MPKAIITARELTEIRYAIAPRLKTSPTFSGGEMVNGRRLIK